MNNNYRNACKEVIELIDYFLSEDEYNRIPKEFINNLQECANKDYDFKIDKSKDLEEQNISIEAKAIIISIYKQFFSNNKEDELIDNILFLNQRKKELLNDDGDNE